MANSGVFPIFLRAEYRDDGKGLKVFQTEAARAAAAAKKEFQGVAAALDAAITRPRNAGGALDLGVDELRRAAQEQQRLAAAAREVAEATKRAATANGAFDASLSRSTKAAFEFAAAQERASREMLEQVTVLDRVQAELAQVASATNTATVATQRNAMVSGQARQGMQQLSFQIGDIATMYALGAKPAQIFASQIGQVTQAVQMMSGGTSRLATFLGGPWGIALTAATIVAAPFVGKLFEAGEASDSMSKALDQARFASDGMASAQSILGDVIDLTTGKMKDQTSQAVILARAQLQLAEVRARVAASEARTTLEGATRRTAQVDIASAGVGSFGGTVFRSVRRPTISAAAARRALDGDTQGALDALKEAVETGRTTAAIYAETATAIANLGAETENMKRFADALKALDGDQKALGQFMRPDRSRTRRGGGNEAARQAREVERLATFGEQAAESIARVNERFDEQPRLVDQAAQATRQLDALIKELGERKPTGFEQMIADAEAAKASVESALLRPFEELRRESAERLQIETLLAQGREDEAVALQEIVRLERQRGGITAEQRAEVEAIVRAEAERTRFLRDQQRLFAAQLDVVDQVQRSLTDLLSGRGGNLFGDFRQALQDLQGQRLFEDLFGEAFRAIRQDLQVLSPQGAANARYAAEVERTAAATATVGDAAISLAQAFDQAFGIVSGSTSRAVAGPANDNGAAISEIVVTARRQQEVRIARMSVMELADRLGASIGAGLGSQLGDLFGPRFAELFGEIAGGAIAGKVTGGNVGAVLGGATKLFESGILGNDNRISAKFGKATEGAATGSQVAAIGKMLGIRGSQTGAQIGGAIGSFVPIPGGQIIGAIAGNIIGGLLKKTPRGAANLTGADQFTLSGNNRGGAQDTARGLAGQVSDQLREIAKQLGATLGSFAVSIGVSGDSFHVDPTGRGRLKKSQGGMDFNQDAEAAVKFAIADAIKDGAILGLSEAQNRLLNSGKDLNAALEDVLTFKSVFDQLDAIRDPVGSAVRSLNREFENLIDLFGRASAGTEELAKLEDLYDIRRAQAIEDATSRVAGSLKALLADLRIGDNGLSLRDRRGNAQSQFDALAARVAAGDSGAFDKFAEVSQQLLDIERQLFGSTQAYFDRLNQVTALTEKAIAEQTNVVSIGTGAPSPFDEAKSVTRAVDAQTDALASRLDAIIANQIAAAGVRSVGAGGRGEGSLLPALVANF